MPHVSVKMFPGRSQAQKEALSAAIAEALKTHAGSSEASISIAIQDVAPEKWTAAVYDPDIAPMMDQLFKKPGYKPA